ncbi:AAA family ATPase [Rariglobus hedericola]|uniref:AAA family ATPase n=1 Tax=Rariglobus hedericola TaxID=2597822 RepID=A0A556QQ64_9BACT|nr:ATP-binding protein [Rariglobus hedericola]TSJ78784.1 AAA family ATPase [Rariglobus hedericola]
MIASVVFRNFKALRSTSLALSPFNLLIGPNGSGKTSLIQAILRLRALAKLPLAQATADAERRPEGAEITFRFDAPHDGLEAVLSCVSDTVCDLLQVVPLPTGEGVDDWTGLRARLLSMRSYLFDHYAIASPALLKDGTELVSNGGNVAAVLAARRDAHPEAFARMTTELIRLLPEYDDLDLSIRADQTVELRLRMAEGGELIAAENLSQGTLYLLAMLTLAYDPAPPAIVCIEEVDRGVHPRMLREIRDTLYRLSYPSEAGAQCTPVQVIATTHSPYLLDLFRDHPEEVVIAEKQGNAARFTRLDERADLAGMLSSGSLGDLWFSGVIGGVPEDK